MGTIYFSRYLLILSFRAILPASSRVKTFCLGATFQQCLCASSNRKWKTSIISMPLVSFSCLLYKLVATTDSSPLRLALLFCYGDNLELAIFNLSQCDNIWGSYHPIMPKPINLTVCWRSHSIISIFDIVAKTQRTTQESHDWCNALSLFLIVCSSRGPVSCLCHWTFHAVSDLRSRSLRRNYFQSTYQRNAAFPYHSLCIILRMSMHRNLPTNLSSVSTMLINISTQSDFYNSQKS